MFTRHNKCNSDYASDAKNMSDLPVYICRGQGGGGWGLFTTIAYETVSYTANSGVFFNKGAFSIITKSLKGSAF